ncbi:hypothetical protein GCM10009117_02680 [Gangjinia marincola]|uniref:RNA helicase n=1 Tax=Gangjinia marincola TaxID=578463 RepID=A0ABN1MDH2_9FLAO
MSTFKALGIAPGYIKSLQELGIETPTAIQSKVIPVLLEKQTDLIGLAQTGTGKTAAFGLPLLHHIDPDEPVIQALVLSPTRELAQQIKKQLFKFTKYNDKKIFAEGIYGGEKIDRQIENLKRTTHIVVATPGRLVDLIEQGVVDLSHIRTVVLDEADEMLSMGFKEELNRILRYTSGKRNTWLFSATMPGEIQQIVKKYMSPKAIQISANKDSIINRNITHHYVLTQVNEKMNVLMNLLDRRKDQRGIIFCRTKATTQNLANQLKDEGFAVEALEGDMKQIDRDKAMRAFKKERVRVLVSTDVSARGIDVNDLGFVLHHQLPESVDYYTHRSGRTARAGKSGHSIALVTQNEIPRMREIEEKLGIRFSKIG